jgi:hypothetical protein
MDNFAKNNDISTVVVHDTNSSYLETSLKISSTYNKVFLIGGESVKYLEKFDNVTFVDINKYFERAKFKRYKEKFEYFGDKNTEIYFFWFIRVFLIYEFLKDNNIDKVFSCDSDNILLKNINSYPFEAENAICIPPVWEEYYFASSIHAGLISQEFCQNYEMLYEDIFINKSRFNLIENKLRYHEHHPGSVTDMTLYHFMVEMKLFKIQNLLEPVFVDNKLHTFMHNLSSAEGPESRKQFKTSKGRIKIYSSKKMLSNMIYDLKNKDYLHLYNIHFQGSAKSLITNKLEQKLHY